jgi:tRNA nucleotidyltransferase (CCA-adding enzyme)
MELALTHEQADFDAIGSLLGAYLLDSKVIPVLPRRMNRNVRAFLTLYGMELPFVDPRDLPIEPVTKVTLVDTQSLVSVRGMEETTSVQVIDHHSIRDQIPPNWVISTDNTGATSTLFVETLEEEDGNLSTVYATLLLLGIYEDTGSLTYSRTTARDLQAAAYLLEQGASLEIASDFLNHPLSPQQQQLYDYLRTSSKSHIIHGHAVVIACGDAQEMDEELSSVAHKLRDLLDPDALFVLVTTRGGVQLIARSNSEDIDVAEIAELFGGGGHERAAAGLVHNRSLESVYQELVNALADHVQPAVTVNQIMSSRPQLLTPDTSVEEAAQLMQRYGHEGYPVVETSLNGQTPVIGLLTRRAVDRALTHKLNLTAASLMNAGEVSVTPEDSIEYLQRLMTETGWGQIPVIDPQRGEVIAIVTRTDLLKTLTREAKLPSKQNLANRLDSVLPPARLALIKTISEIAHEKHIALFIVGGFVRDLLLDRPGLDFDLVVEGDAIELARTLADRFGGRVTSHSRFGTAKWHIAPIREKLIKELCSNREISHVKDPNQSDENPKNDLPEFLDLISARTEFYNYPSALPTVERSSIKLDLHRRDFTINTMALRLDGHHYGELHDYWGGLSDLRHGLVRVLHSLSFVDDPTRMLRAVRFEQRFGFQIEERTLELIAEAQSMIGKVSGDRIRHELDHIFIEDRAAQMIGRLNELTLLSEIHPDLIWDGWLTERAQKIRNSDLPINWPQLEKDRGYSLQVRLFYILWLIRLPYNRVRKIISRFKIPRNLSLQILSARHLWQELPSLISFPPSRIVTHLEDISLVSIYATYMASQDPVARDILDKFVTQWQNINPATDGNRLRQLGVAPGPIYRQIILRLRDAWLDGKISSPGEEEKLLHQILSEPDPLK